MGTLNKILILHGWSYSTDKWVEFSSLLSKSGVKIEILKIPGLTAKTDKTWSLDDYVEWLQEKVSKEKQKVILLGHSNGGRIALAFAARYPQKVNYLILIDSAGVRHNELSIKMKRFIFRKAATFGKKLTSSSVLRNFLYKLARESDYKNATPEMRQTMINLISHDLTPILNRISVPTLLIWGELDKSTPLSDGKLMHKLIKNSKLEVIDSAEHSPQFTHAEEVSKIINESINL